MVVCAKNVGSVRKKFTKGPRRLSKAHCWEGMRANWIFKLGTLTHMCGRGLCTQRFFCEDYCKKM